MRPADAPVLPNSSDRLLVVAHQGDQSARLIVSFPEQRGLVADVKYGSAGTGAEIAVSVATGSL